MESKWTEDQTVFKLIDHLKDGGWMIESYCTGHKRGVDIIAVKNKSKIFIEVKGAKANDSSPIKSREHFDAGQIKTHFGKAIIKAIETKLEHPDAIIAIAHPNDGYIRKVIGPLIPSLKFLDIIHYWVDENEIHIN